MSDVEWDSAGSSESGSFDEDSRFDDSRQSPPPRPHDADPEGSYNSGEESGSYYSEHGGKEGSDSQSYSGSYSQASGEIHEPFAPFVPEDESTWIEPSAPVVFQNEGAMFGNDDYENSNSSEREGPYYSDAQSIDLFDGGSVGSHQEGSYYSDSNDGSKDSGAGSVVGSEASEDSDSSGEQTNGYDNGSAVDSQISYYSDDQTNDVEAKSVGSQASLYSDERSGMASGAGSVASQSSFYSTDEETNDHEAASSVGSQSSFYSNETSNDSGTAGSAYSQSSSYSDTDDDSERDGSGVSNASDHSRSSGGKQSSVSGDQEPSGHSYADDQTFDVGEDYMSLANEEDGPCLDVEPSKSYESEGGEEEKALADNAPSYESKEGSSPGGIDDQQSVASNREGSNGVEGVSVSKENATVSTRAFESEPSNAPPAVLNSEEQSIPRNEVSKEHVAASAPDAAVESEPSNASAAVSDDEEPKAQCSIRDRIAAFEKKEEKKPVTASPSKISIRDRIAAFDRNKAAASVSPEKNPTVKKERFGSESTKLQSAPVELHSPSSASESESKSLSKREGEGLALAPTLAAAVQESVPDVLGQRCVSNSIKDDEELYEPRKDGSYVSQGEETSVPQDDEDSDSRSQVDGDDDGGFFETRAVESSLVEDDNDKDSFFESPAVDIPDMKDVGDSFIEARLDNGSSSNSQEHGSFSSRQQEGSDPRDEDDSFFESPSVQIPDLDGEGNSFLESPIRNDSFSNSRGTGSYTLEASDSQSDDDSFFESPDVQIPDLDGEAGSFTEALIENGSYTKSEYEQEIELDTSHESEDEVSYSANHSFASGQGNSQAMSEDNSYESSATGFDSFANASETQDREEEKSLPQDATAAGNSIDDASVVECSSGAEEASGRSFQDFGLATEDANRENSDGSFKDNSQNSFDAYNEDIQEKDFSSSPGSSFGEVSKGSFFGQDSAVSIDSAQRRQGSPSVKSHGSGSATSTGKRSVGSAGASASGSHSRQRSVNSGNGSQDGRSYVSGNGSQGSYVSGNGSQGTGSYFSGEGSYVSGDGSQGDDSQDAGSYVSGEGSYVSGDGSQDAGSYVSGERSYVSGDGSQNTGSYVSGEGSDFSGEGSQNTGSYVSGEGSYVSGEGSQDAGSYVSSEGSYVSGEGSQDPGSYVSDEGSYISGEGSHNAGSYVSGEGSQGAGSYVSGSYVSGEGSQDAGSYISGEGSYSSGEGSQDSGSYVSGEDSRDAGSFPEESGHEGSNGSEGRSDGHSQDEGSFYSEEDAVPTPKLPKPNTYGGYSREQMARVTMNARSAVASPGRKKKKQANIQGKSDALLDLVGDVHDAMVDLEKLQEEKRKDKSKKDKPEDASEVEKPEGKGGKPEGESEEVKPESETEKDSPEGESKDVKAESEPKEVKQDGEPEDVDFENMLTSTRLLYAFEALAGILLQLSDELELLLTFSKGKDSPPIEALDALLSYAETIGDTFLILRPILHNYQTEEIDEELDDFLYGMNLVVDLLCELSNRVGEKQQWNARANCSYATMLELLARDTLEVSCIYEDVDTPDYELSDIIQDAWEETGHVEEVKTLLVTNDLFMFRQICYEVILSTDQWCPDNNTLMDICGVDDEADDNQIKADNGDLLSPPPEAALQILEKIHGDPLPRTATIASVLRRLLPTQAITDPAISENFARIRNTIRNPLGMPPSSLVAITSIPESLDDPESLGIAGVGKTTMAAMVSDHEDVRRFFNDGIAWIYVGEAELNYNRYVQCLQDLLSQLEVEEDEEPLFPELLHSPGDSPAKRRRREEGFMIYLRETMVEFLRFRNVLVILDDVCFEPDLDWFDFAPAPLPPEEEEEEEEEGSCAVLITSRRRDLLPPADTVEVDMLSEDEAVELLKKESGELSRVLKSDAPETKSLVFECACHPLTVKSVGRWLNLKHATGSADSVDDIQEDVVKSMDKILKGGLHEDSDMTYEILGMSLSPAINGEPTSIIKVCFAAFVRVFCERKHISDFALADSTPIVPMATTVLLFESLLELEEESLLQEGSLFYAQRKEAATLIPEALSALGVFKVIITYAEAPEDSPDQEEEDEKYLQVMHRIQQEYGEYLYEEDESLTELTKDGERRWNKAFAKAFLARNVDWDTESPDAGQDYALEMLPSHMLRGGMLTETGNLLSNESFVRGRLFALGRENGTRRHIKDCEALFDLLKEKRSKGHRKVDVKGIMRTAYDTLGILLPMDEEEFIEEEGSPEAVEVGRCHFELGYSLAQKRIWDGAISHWEDSQEFLVSSLGMVEFVAGILYNIGVVFSEMNEYEQALGSLRQCLRIRGAIHGEEHILYAQTIQKIGDIFLSMSDYYEAMESYNWALDVMHIEPSHHRIDIGDILEQMGNIHYSKGEIHEALQSFQDALRSKQVDLGEDHPELSTLFHHIGNCLSNQGRTDEAIAHLEEAIRLKQLDPDGGFERDSDVLTIEGILNNITGKQQEGLMNYEKALQVLVTKVPHKKEKVASLLHLIGCVYLMSGEHKKAMKLFEESLHARRKVLGFVHLDVASTLFNMAFLHQTRNRLDKALKCLEEALKIRELRLPDSEKVAVTHEKIGNLARGIGKTKKAENAFSAALRIRKLVHGDSHVAVATVLQELGDLTDDLGEYEEAMKHYVEALEIRESLLGPDDLAVAETYYSMGFTLQNNGALDRALQCLEESLSIRRFQLGDDAKDVGDTLNMMGFLQANRGELDDALSLLWDALRIRKLQGDNIKVSETLNNIGNVHREKQEYDLAIECYEECLRIRRSELGDEHEKVADALIAMGNVQSDMDYTDDAMDSYKEALAIRTMLFGEQDESVATVLQYMGTLEFRANELDRAFQLLDEFIRIRQENGTDPDGDYVNVLFMIGNIHKMLGGEEEAKKCWTEAYGVFKELGLAETNPQIAEVMSNLVKDEDVDAGPDKQNDDGKKTSVLGRITAKVKSAARTANEAGNVVKKMKGQDRGNQLL